MKTLIALLTLISAFAAHASELQLQECKFGKRTFDFTPNSFLTSELSALTNGAIVYKVKVKDGKRPAQPIDQLAIIQEGPSKTLNILTFDTIDTAGAIIYRENLIVIDLKAPVKTDEPIIKFESTLLNREMKEGTCSLMF